jgi:DNA replication protein DnaC
MQIPASLRSDFIHIASERSIHIVGIRRPLQPSTNLGYDEWPNFLGNRPMVEALLSRLRHYCHTVLIDGPSLREPQG